MALKQPVEQPMSQAASNQAYYAYARKNQRKYVKSRVPTSVKYRSKKGMAERAGPKPAFKVEECTAHYLKTLMNPFDAPAGACLPADAFPLPSQKIKVFARGTMVLGTTGYGFVIASGSLVNDPTGGAIATTTAASVMASNTLLTAAVGVISYDYLELPWTQADVAANLVQGRLVAMGLRVRYSGTEANRNGLMNFYEDQDHAAFNTLSYDSIRQRVNCYSCRPPGDGTWESVLYSGPVAPAETEFRNVNLLSVNQAALLACVVKGNMGDVYEFEVFQHIETIGVKSTGKSASHADPTNYGKAQEVAKNESGAKSLSVTDGPSVVGQFIEKVIQAAPFVVDQASNVIKALGGNPMALLEGMASSAGLIYRSVNPRGPYPAVLGQAGNRLMIKNK